MGDQASRRLLRGHAAAICPWRIFLHASLSRRRWLPARGFERRRVAKPKRKYSAVFVLEIPFRAAPAEAARTSSQGKCRAALSASDGVEFTAGKRLLRSGGHARTKTGFEASEY